ncbi:hypothetical protein [Pseudomonas sp. UBA6315]|uniref:hypothetical protein n=1 Tax=Pseudomonas sp. UBA6315 TaxID=1947328 RepID=UPI00257DDA7E|nr:hypothetical protein [Pseudomonas sp. UBA6315]
MMLKHTNTAQQAFSGNMQAKLTSGAEFNASSIGYQPEFGIIAIDDKALNDEPFIYIGFPDAMGVGSHPIKPQGQGSVWAFLGVQGKGQANTGTLVIKEEPAPGVISAKFTFEGVGEDGQAFEVTQGTFIIRPHAKPKGIVPAFAASAKISPVLSGNAGFDADTIFARTNDAGRHSILVTQQSGLAGGLSGLGTYFYINSNGEGNVFAVVNQGLYASREKTITNFEFEENVRLSFDFSYSFTGNGTDYKVSDGHLEIDWRPK